MSHILSISGFHVNLIFSMVHGVLSLMPSMIFTFLYLALTGLKVSGVRAFSMMVIREIAPRVYRTYDGINALCFVGSLILLFKPYEMFSLGFIYSFASTMGIFVFNKKVKDRLYMLPRIIADPLSLTLSAQIVIFPILLFINRKLEFGFILSNILLVPFYSILIALGFLYIFVFYVPLVRDIMGYVIDFIFDMIDGGLIFLDYLTPKSLYLLNSTIIFIMSAYILFLFWKHISRGNVRKIFITLSFVYLGFNTMFATQIEVGEYYDKNYVIVRNYDRNYLYLNGKLNNEDYLIDKLGIDKIFKETDNMDLLFRGKLSIDFEGNDTLLYIDKNRIVVPMEDEDNKYYDDIYPKKYYVTF